jgi:hypothetical protein
MPINECVSIKQPQVYLHYKPARNQVSIDIYNCCISKSGCFSVTATISRATAKSLAEGQAVLDGHHVIKHRVHGAGEEIETPCNILTNFCNN